MNLSLDNDFSGFKIGAIINTDVATESLSQINSSEGLREDEEAGESHGVGEMLEEESVAIVGIGGVVGGGGGGERRGGGGVVEDVFTDEEVGGVEAEGWVDVEGRSAKTHNAEREGMRSSSSLSLTHLQI